MSPIQAIARDLAAMWADAAMRRSGMLPSVEKVFASRVRRAERAIREAKAVDAVDQLVQHAVNVDRGEPALTAYNIANELEIDVAAVERWRMRNWRRQKQLERAAGTTLEALGLEIYECDPEIARRHTERIAREIAKGECLPGVH